MIAYGAIAEAAITEGRRPSTGVEIILVPVTIALGLAASVVVSGATVDAAPASVSITAPALVSGAGVAIDLVPTDVALSATATSAVSGAVVDLALLPIALTVPATSVVSGAAIDVLPTAVQISANPVISGSGAVIDVLPATVVIDSPVLIAASGASVTLQALYPGLADFAIAGGAITEPPRTYTYGGPIEIAIAVLPASIVSGAVLDLALMPIAVSAPPIEIIARPRKVRALAIAS